MNRNLIQLNKNCGIVSDEKGNMSLVSEENDFYNFKKILLRENKVENLKLELENAEKEQSDNKRNLKINIPVNILLIAMEIIIYLNLPVTYPLTLSISIVAYTYTIFKALASLMYGTIIGNLIKKKRLTSNIEKMELDLSILEKGLKRMKERSNYKVDYSTAIESKTTSTGEINHELSLPIDSHGSEEVRKVKVLSLLKRK